MKRWMRGASGSAIDAVAAALSTFVGGVVALSSLDGNAFAAYALFSTASIAAATLPQQIAYLPHRLHVNKHTEKYRGRYFGEFRSALATSLIAAVLVLFSGIPVAWSVSLETYVGLAGSAALYVIVSPMQDHMRASMYIAGRSRVAAVMSVINLAILASVLLVILSVRAELSPLVLALIPFGALVTANLVSITVGGWLARELPAVPKFLHLSPGLGLKTGANAMIVQTVAYATNAIVGVLLGPAALATLEAARVAAQPVFVAGSAVNSALTPHIVRSKAAGDERSVWLWTRRALMLVLAIGAGYSILLPLLITPLSVVSGRSISYGLSAARALAFAAQMTTRPLTQLNLASERYVFAFWTAIASAGGGLVLLVPLIYIIGVYAVPASLLAAATIRWGIWIFRLTRGRSE